MRACPAPPWSGERLPAQATTWIERGVVQALPVGRYWAAKTGREPRPAAGTVVMDGGKGSVDDLISGVRARSAGDPLLVHPHGQPPDHPVDRAYPRRSLAG